MIHRVSPPVRAAFRAWCEESCSGQKSAWVQWKKQSGGDCNVNIKEIIHKHKSIMNIMNNIIYIYYIIYNIYIYIFILCKSGSDQKNKKNTIWHKKHGSRSCIWDFLRVCLKIGYPMVPGPSNLWVVCSEVLARQRGKSRTRPMAQRWQDGCIRR